MPQVVVMSGSPTPALVADVQDWLSRPETNFGWAIVGNEVDLKVAKRIESREIEDESKRPDPHREPRLHVRGITLGALKE